MEHLLTKRILITGALGYIGSETFKIIKNHFKECLAMDGLADGSNNVQNLDLKDAAKTLKVITDFKPDVIIHFATHSALAYKESLPTSFKEDFSSTTNILHTLSGMPDCRLIYFSSSYVYSGLPIGQAYDESSPLMPLHNFGVAKSFFEQYILRTHPNTVIFRLSSVFGPGRALHPNVILAFAKECINNKSLTVWGKGKRKLQYIYMKDVVNIILGSFAFDAGIYNLGGDDYVSVYDTARDIANFFGVGVTF